MSLPFGGNFQGVLGMREADQMLRGLRIASWQSDDGVLGTEVVRQILNPWVRVMQSMCSEYELEKSQIIGLKLYGDG